MKMTSRVLCILWMCCGFVLGSCSLPHTITKRSEMLGGSARTGTVAFYSRDSSIYVLRLYHLLDSTIVGSGYRTKDGHKEIVVQKQIPLEDILYIQTRPSSAWSGWIMAGAIGGFITAATQTTYTSSSATFDIVTGVYYPPASGSSCPLIYSWNGTDHILEGEAIGVALGKSLEMTSRLVLPSARQQDESVTVRVANERPETHVINEVRLYAVETDAARIGVDQDHRIWPVRNGEKPVAATDRFSLDVLERIEEKDGCYLEPDPMNQCADAAFEDVVELAFVRPSNGREASLIVDAINTELSGVVFEQVYAFMGEQSLAFIHATEHDSDMISLLKAWQQDASTKVEVWDGSSWKQAGSILPEASAVPFTRMVRLQAPEQDTIRVRLRSLAGVWRYDAVEMDWTDESPLPLIPLRLQKALTRDGNEVSRSVLECDEEYSALLPPDYIDASFDGHAPHEGMRTVYVLDVGGYLYEWIPPMPQSTTVSLASFVPETDRLRYLKHLLANRELFLPVIYSAWRQSAER